MAKLDMRKALAGAVAPLDAKKLAEESVPDLRVVEMAAPVAATEKLVDEPVLRTNVVDALDASPELETDQGSTRPVSPPGRSASRATAPSKSAAIPSPASASPATAMGVDVEAGLDARLVAYRAATRLSFHQIILDAVEQSYPILADLISKALGREASPAPQVKLFERTFVPPPVPLGEKQERITHTIRITSSNRSMLDSIAAETESPSRNFMICVALDNYLPNA